MEGGGDGFKQTILEEVVVFTVIYAIRKVLIMDRQVNQEIVICFTTRPIVCCQTTWPNITEQLAILMLC